MTFTLGDATDEALKMWGLDEVPRDHRRQEFAKDVFRIYTKMQPQKSVARKTTLEDFYEF
ncbi:MAG: hypothetical protein ACYCT2_04360 [Thermoplasmataceae archaeon]